MHWKKRILTGLLKNYAIVFELDNKFGAKGATWFFLLLKKIKNLTRHFAETLFTENNFLKNISSKLYHQNNFHRIKSQQNFFSTELWNVFSCLGQAPSPIN